MQAEAQGRSTGRSSGLPSGVYQRQSWRPPAVRTAESLVAGIIRSAGPFVHNAARLSAWHEQFIRRARPWPGWSPLSLEFPTEAVSSEGRASEAAALARIPGSDSAISRTSPPPAQRAASPAHHVTDAPALSRPAMALAILPAAQVTHITSRSEAANDPAVSLMPGGHILWCSSPVADVPISQPRLALSLSPTPRQEVRGGFPIDHLSQPALPEAERTSTAPAPARTAPLEASALAQRAAALPDALPEVQGAIEKLIERTVLPVSLPGLELRLVSLEQPAAAIHRPPSATDSRPPADASTSPAPAPTPPLAPQLDINAVAEKVYQTLMRRQQLERERRGLY